MFHIIRSDIMNELTLNAVLLRIMIDLSLLVKPYSEEKHE